MDTIAEASEVRRLGYMLYSFFIVLSGTCLQGFFSCGVVVVY